MMWLLETTVKMSLVLAIGLVAAMVMQWSSAALRHWVTAVAVFLAAAVPVLSLVAPAWTLAQPSRISHDSRPGMAIPAGGPAQGDAIPLAGPSNPRAVPVVNQLSDVVLPIWLIGAALNLLILSVAFFRLSRLASRAAVVRAGRWVASLSDVSRTLGVHRPIALLLSDRPAILVTWGRASPTVLLPSDAGDWSDERVHIVLAHELAHVARGDWLVQIGAELLRCVYWFNPVLWIACARLRHESERACDDAVMNTGVESAVYATHLLELARTFGTHRRTWLPAPAMAGRRSTLERRINAMLNNRLNRRPITTFGRCVSWLALLAVTLPIAAFAQGSFGSVYGVVVDPTDRVLPGTTVTVTDGQRHITHQLRTDRDGRFELMGLPPGPYTMEAKSPGFQTRTDTFSANGQAVARNLKLEIGTLQETISVTGRGGATNTERVVVSTARRRAMPVCQSASAVGGNIRAPQKIRDVRPAYPGVDGHVALAARIATDGSVADVRVVRSDRPELEGAAIAAVSQWQFDETLLNCVPVEVVMNVDVDFRPEP